MRWRDGQRLVDGETERVVSRFLWLPKKIGGESRWLESVRIRQRYFSVSGSGYWMSGWDDIAWESP